MQKALAHGLSALVGALGDIAAFGSERAGRLTH